MTTLAELNQKDTPRELGGRLLGNDARGNQLWLFVDRCVERVANRHETDDGVEWSGDVEGWNYSDEDALL